MSVSKSSATVTVRKTPMKYFKCYTYACLYKTERRFAKSVYKITETE